MTKAEAAKAYAENLQKLEALEKARGKFQIHQLSGVKHYEAQSELCQELQKYAPQAYETVLKRNQEAVALARQALDAFEKESDQGLRVVK